MTIIDEKLIKAVFQPIISLRNGSIFGHEALSRGPEHSIFKNPELLFNYAIKYDKIWELELLCRTKSLESLQKHHQTPIKTKLFLNVNPNIIHDIKFKQGFTKRYLNDFSFQPDQIIFEITEKGNLANVDDFKKTVQNYKAQNYQIAIDDAGAGLSGLNMISDIRPHYIKLDMNLIRDIDTDSTKQALVKSMVEFAKLSNTKLVAEGIETKEELLALIDFGVNYGQGYFIQRPNTRILPISPDVEDTIKNAYRQKKERQLVKVLNSHIGHITTKQEPLSPNIEIHEVHELMNQDPNIPGFCITEADELIGVVTRNKLYSLLGSQYGYALYANKHISMIMDTEFLQVDFQDQIEEVSRTAMKRNPSELYDFVSVVKDQKYYGTVTVKDLLENTIELKTNYAKHLNPISGLPGNLLIEQEIEHALTNNPDFTLLYIDIDNFKAYNDVYGFEKGDFVIKFLAEILQKSIDKSEFLGHVGGDDFITLITRPRVTELCEKILEEFEGVVESFYDLDDFERGYIVTKNRNHVKEKFPLLSLSISGVVNQNYQNGYEITRQVSKVKRLCKKKIGNSYLIQ